MQCDGDKIDCQGGSQIRRMVYYNAAHLDGKRHPKAGVYTMQCDGDKIDCQDGPQIRCVVHHDAAYLHGDRHPKAGVYAMQCNGDKTDCQDGSQLGRRESGRTTDNKPRGSYAMDMQYVRHDTHKSNSQAQAGNDCGSAHNTDSGAYGSTTHIRHSYTEGLAHGIT